MMYCSKCGTENVEGNAFCASCGAPLPGGIDRGQEVQKADMLAQLSKSLPPGALTMGAALLIILGAILPWESSGRGSLGLMMAQGAVLCMVAVLSVAVLLLQRSGAAGAWPQVSALLAVFAVLLVFQALYHITDWNGSIGAGYWLSMVGVLILAISSLLPFLMTLSGSSGQR